MDITGNVIMGDDCPTAPLEKEIPFYTNSESWPIVGATGNVLGSDYVGRTIQITIDGKTICRKINKVEYDASNEITLNSLLGIDKISSDCCVSEIHLLKRPHSDSR